VYDIASLLELVDPYSARAARIYQSLECRSFFTSWGWVENWLACLPRDRAPRLAVFDGVAAGFFARHLDLRRRVIASRALHFNTLGIPRFDDIWVEYNGLVGADLPLATIVDALPAGWDELILPALDPGAFGGVAGADHPRYRVRVDRTVPVYFVDLDAVRARGFHALVSSQTRSQIRRAERLAAPLSHEVAGDLPTALTIYEELCALHTAQWRAKGKPGAFADPWFDRFHRRLIAQRFAAGEIQMVRVRANGATLGCLYNFVWRDRILQYQSGFATFADARMKPGFVSHARAIEHAATAGLAVYDWLGGEMRYKQSLSTGNGWLVWCRVQRRRVRFALEDRLVRLMSERRAKLPR
jgi:hypothetical protein